MLQNINILSAQRRLICLILAVGIAAIAFASESLGDGGDKPKVSITSGFALSPLRVHNSFTLKAGPFYGNNSMFSEAKTNSFLTVNSVVTYQKGNTTYILPFRHKVSIEAAKSNLQAVNVKVSIRR